MKFSYIVADTFLDLMLCPFYESMNDGACDEANNKYVCLYDGGDCSVGENATRCTSFDCIDNLKFDPCPKYDTIGNGQCDKENFNLICSFDAGDCKNR